MKWFVLYQIISGDFEGVGVGGFGEEKDFFRGFRQKSADAKTAKAPLRCERVTPGLKPRPPKETARAQAGMPVPRWPV